MRISVLIMQKFKDYYAVLGVSPTAGSKEIRRAFRKLALECHPDRHPDNVAAAQRFIQGSEAYEALSDDAKRAIYHYDWQRNTGNFSTDFASSFEERRPQEEVIPSQKPIFYQGLYWEPRAYRRPGRTEKEAFDYDESLERLRRAGYGRHARSAEVMQLLKAGLEGKLTDAEQPLFDDMCDGREWLSEAVEVKYWRVGRGLFPFHIGGSKLTTYLDPEGLIWNKEIGEDEYLTNQKRYLKQNFTYKEKQDFDITRTLSYISMELRALPDPLIEHLYGSPYTELPKEMQQGWHMLMNPNHWVPPSRFIRPIAYSTKDYLPRTGHKFWIDLDGFVSASRGVSSINPILLEMNE